MIAMTTSSSISVNARRPKHRCDIRVHMAMRNFQMAYSTYPNAVWQMVLQFGMVKTDVVGYE